MRRSQVDRRANKQPARQCVSDTGHKDAPIKRPKVWRFIPLRDQLRTLQVKR